MKTQVVEIHNVKKKGKKDPLYFRNFNAFFVFFFFFFFFRFH